jgi:hypothetical protein
VEQSSRWYSNKSESMREEREEREERGERGEVRRLEERRG